MNTKRVAVLVELDVLDTDGVAATDGSDYVGYTPIRDDAVEYVRDAVKSWGGQRHPTDPFFNIKKVVVR